MPKITHQLLYNWLVDIKKYGTVKCLYNSDMKFYTELCFIIYEFLPNKIFRAKETYKDRHTICKLVSIGAKRVSGIYNLDLRKCCTCEAIYEPPFIWCPCCGRLLRIKKRDKAYTMYDKMHDKVVINEM